MAIEFKDYYETLGVSREADQADVRRAFRRLARKFHPDVAHDNQEAEDKFKEINEANAVLGDPDKRRKYDKLGEAWDSKEGFAPFSGVGEDFEFHFAGTGFSDFFEKFFSSDQTKREIKKERRTRPRDAGPSSRKEEAPRDGAGNHNRKSAGDESAINGTDVEADLMVTLEEAIHGAARPITVRLKLPCTACSADGSRCIVCKGQGFFIKTIHPQVRIPPGVKEGQKLRLRGKGHTGPHGEPQGDLYLNVKIAADPDLRLDDGALIHDLDLAPWEAVLGTEVEVTTPRGRVRIKVPSGIQSEGRLRLPGHGVVDENGQNGDLTIIAHIKVPTRMTKAEYAIWKDLATKTHFNPREL